MINLLSAILLFIGSIFTAIGLFLLYSVLRIRHESKEVEIKNENQEQVYFGKTYEE